MKGKSRFVRSSHTIRRSARQPSANRRQVSANAAQSRMASLRQMTMRRSSGKESMVGVPIVRQVGWEARNKGSGLGSVRRRRVLVAQAWWRVAWWSVSHNPPKQYRSHMQACPQRITRHLAVLLHIIVCKIPVPQSGTSPKCYAIQW